MDLRQAVKKTTAYAGYFNFPLSPEEIHLWLITPHPVPLSLLKKYLPSLDSNEIKLREKLLKNTQSKLREVEKLIKIVRFLPSIRLLALTGSMAMNNSQKGDDIDLLIVTAKHTLWITRLLFLLLLSLGFSRRHPYDREIQTENAFCPNLWLETGSLEIPKKIRSLYTAHEVLQVKPVLDRGNTYERFIFENSWTKTFLANAYLSLSKGKSVKNQRNSLTFLIFPLNYILFLLQYLYMLPKKTSEKVTLHSAFFHKTDLSGSLEELLSGIKT